MRIIWQNCVMMVLMVVGLFIDTQIGSYHRLWFYALVIMILLFNLTKDDALNEVKNG